jgi:hypothetical protein
VDISCSIGKNRGMAVFDALDGPQHATLWRAAPQHRVAGWAAIVAGLAALLLLLALGDGTDAVETVAIGAFMAPLLWLAIYRRDLRAGLAAPGPVTDGATFRPPVRRRGIARFFVFLAGVVACVASGTMPSAGGIVLGLGAVELAVAFRLHRWERQNGRTLYRASFRMDELYAR